MATRIRENAQREAQMAELFGRLKQCSTDPVRGDTVPAGQHAVRLLQPRADHLPTGHAAISVLGKDTGRAASPKRQDTRGLPTATSITWLAKCRNTGSRPARRWPQARRKCAKKPPENQDPPDQPPDQPEVDVGRSWSARRVRQRRHLTTARRSASVARPLRQKRGHQKALAVCAIAACRMRDESSAQSYIRQIRSAGQRSIAEQICLSSGIQVEK